MLFSFFDSTSALLTMNQVIKKTNWTNKISRRTREKISHMIFYKQVLLISQELQSIVSCQG